MRVSISATRPRVRGMASRERRRHARIAWMLDRRTGRFALCVRIKRTMLALPEAAPRLPPKHAKKCRHAPSRVFFGLRDPREARGIA
jgi:hypothetical protein